MRAWLLKPRLNWAELAVVFAVLPPLLHRHWVIAAGAFLVGSFVLGLLEGSAMHAQRKAEGGRDE